EKSDNSTSFRAKSSVRLRLTPLQALPENEVNGMTFCTNAIPVRKVSLPQKDSDRVIRSGLHASLTLLYGTIAACCLQFLKSTHAEVTYSSDTDRRRVGLCEWVNGLRHSQKHINLLKASFVLWPVVLLS